MSRRNALLAASTALALLSITAPGSHGAELVMFERAGCVWCARFDAEIAPIYPKTEASRTAPLRRIDLGRPLPADLAGIDPGAFTPTFVVVDKGREIGRIRGYPGEDFFFGFLERILTATDVPAGPVTN